MPDSKDVVWENTPKKLLPCTILEDSEKMCAMVEEKFPRASRKEEEQEKLRGKK